MCKSLRYQKEDIEEDPERQMISFVYMLQLLFSNQFYYQKKSIDLIQSLSKSQWHSLWTYKNNSEKNITANTDEDMRREEPLLIHGRRTTVEIKMEFTLKWFNYNITQKFHYEVYIWKILSHSIEKFLHICVYQWTIHNSSGMK